MFDRYLVTPRPNVTVHNHIEQKPHDTADAARLYGEMVAKAEAEVASATVERLGAENEATLVRVDSERSDATCQQLTRVLFKVNGRLHDIRDVQNSKARDELCRAIANAIAEQVYRKLRSPSTVNGEQHG